MSTRSVIARKTKTGFFGRYHHWDGYPSSLGKTLYGLYNGHFKRNLDKMLTVLIDEHPAGWSTINGKDFKKKPGYIDHNNEYGKNGKVVDLRPIYYGDRHEEKIDLNHRNASGCGCEYAYVFSMETRIKGKGRKEPVMTVLSSYHLSGDKMIGFFGMGDENSIWMPIGRVFLNDSEPNWESMKKIEPSLDKIVIEILKDRGIIFPGFKKEKKNAH
jgi:hypothetical protein